MYYVLKRDVKKSKPWCVFFGWLERTNWYSTKGRSSEKVKSHSQKDLLTHQLNGQQKQKAIQLRLHNICKPLQWRKGTCIEIQRPNMCAPEARRCHELVKTTKAGPSEVHKTLRVRTKRSGAAFRVHNFNLREKTAESFRGRVFSAFPGTEVARNDQWCWLHSFVWRIHHVTFERRRSTHALLSHCVLCFSSCCCIAMGSELLSEHERFANKQLPAGSLLWSCPGQNHVNGHAVFPYNYSFITFTFAVRSSHWHGTSRQLF